MELDPYEQVTEDVLQFHLHEHEKFEQDEQRSLPKAQWKVLKTVEKLSVFSQTVHTPEVCPGMSEDCMKMAMTGSMVGTVEDALYGSLAPDAKSMKINMSYMDGEATDCRVLAQIMGPTASHPFQYLGIKATATSIRDSARGRLEFVYLERMGIHSNPKTGERLGYHIVHSLPDACGSDEISRTSLRGKTSMCFLFKQAPNSTVDVYVRVWFDPRGDVSDRVATTMMTHSLLSAAKRVTCAQNKKLTWLVKAAVSEQRQKLMRRRQPAAMTPSRTQSCCKCGKSETMFRALSPCALCESPICAKCRVSRKLRSVRSAGDMRVIAKNFCVACIARAATTSTEEVVIQRHVAHPPGPHLQHHGRMQDPTMAASTGNRTRVLSQPQSSCSTDAMLEAYATSSSECIGYPLATPTSSSSSSTTSPMSWSPTDSLNRQQVMQLQMQQLLSAAQETYHQTQMNDLALEDSIQGSDRGSHRYL